MHKKLIRYDGWRLAEADPVRLKRTAVTLRDQIIKKIDAASDQYGFHATTLPVLDAAIRGEIIETLDEDKVKFIPGNYLHDKREGLLPAYLDREFTKAVSDFRITAKGILLEPAEDIVRDGITYACVEFEDEGDWPERVKYP